MRRRVEDDHTILEQRIDAGVKGVEPKVIAYRRDIHGHPELGNREWRTARVVSDRLRELGLEVRTAVAHTGVVGVLHGARAGRVLGLRADMDALPISEAVDLPFKSTVRASFNGDEVGVMHACGHDAHVAILLGVAEVLSNVRDRISGTIVFLFQPAEEGAPPGEEGGARLMVQEGALRNPDVEAIFGLHVTSRYPVGELAYRSGVMMASLDSFQIVVHGMQTHAAYPWLGVDPIVIASQIVLGLQTIPSRQMDSSLAPSIVTVAAIRGGVRQNIIPDEVEMIGTIRAFDGAMRDSLHARVRRTAEDIARSGGGTAVVTFEEGAPIVYNDPGLTEQMVPVFHRIAGASNVRIANPVLGSEDFAFYQQRVPGLFFWLGTRPASESAASAPPSHSPLFYVDESGLALGMRALAGVAVRYLSPNYQDELEPEGA
jgi:amidohydrolase